MIDPERNRRDFEYLNQLPADKRAAALRGEAYLPNHSATPYTYDQPGEPVSRSLHVPQPTPRAPVVPERHTPAPGGRRLIVRNAREYTPAAVQWLWPRRFGLGKLALIGGPADAGKSNLIAYIVATVTAGGLWPCREGRAPQGRAIMLFAEDNDADTTVPRLKAAGADPSRVEFITGVDDGANGRAFSLRTDLGLLAEKIRAFGDVRLVVFDPISSYLGGADSHRNDRMRELLDPLAAMAAKHRVAVIAVTHPPKGHSANPADQFIGSIAFNAAARSSFLLLPDPLNEHRRLFFPVKSNLSIRPGTLAFGIVQREVDPGVNGTYLIWEESPARLSIRDVLARRSAHALARSDAEAFLRDQLQGGAVAVAEIEQAARAAGLLKAGQPISQCWALRAARAALRIKVNRSGSGADLRFTWELAGKE